MSLSKPTALLLIASSIFLSSCIGIRYLNQAQDNFNQGAALENQLRFNPQTDILTSPSLYYLSAYADVNHALQKKDKLKKDDLLSSAYVIKALCEWRLKKYDQAKVTADWALGEIINLERKGIQLPRDKAIMETLPFLISIEQVYHSLNGIHTPRRATCVASRDHYGKEIFDVESGKKAKLEEAFDNIGDIRARSTDTPEVSLYLVQAQLTALKTWSDALNYLRESAQNEAGFGQNEINEIRSFCKKHRDDFLSPRKDELIRELEKIRGKGDSLVSYWDRII
jgi:hypothetical protein